MKIKIDKKFNKIMEKKIEDFNNIVIRPNSYKVISFKHLTLFT